MRYSGVGGQAVMEGVMMRNGDEYAVAVRTADKEIVVQRDEYHSFIKNKKILTLPIIRGVFNFVDSMVLGMKTLMFSADFFAEETEGELEERLDKERKKAEKKAEKLEKQGKVLIVAPNDTCGIDTTKRDKDGLMRLYRKFCEEKKCNLYSFIPVPTLLYRTISL